MWVEGEKMINWILGPMDSGDKAWMLSIVTIALCVAAMVCVYNWTEAMMFQANPEAYVNLHSTVLRR